MNSAHLIDAQNLQAINLNKGLRILENRAFEKCTNLVSLNIPESIEKIGNGYGYYFKDCKNLKDVISVYIIKK